MCSLFGQSRAVLLNCASDGIDSSNREAHFVPCQPRRASYPTAMFAFAILIFLCAKGGRVAEAHVYNASEFCDLNFEMDDCVDVVTPCGDFMEGTRNLTVIGFNAEFNCLVASLSGEGEGTHAACNASSLAMASRQDCTKGGIRKEGEAVMVWGAFFVVHCALLLVACCWKGQITHGVLFWWSDFFAGLTWNVMVALYVTSGIKDPVLATIQNFLCAMLYEELLYDLPLMAVRKCCPVSIWIFFTWSLGLCYGVYAIILAYEQPVVILMGHHAIVYGFYQWFLDILKAAGKKKAMQRMGWFKEEEEPKETDESRGSKKPDESEKLFRLLLAVLLEPLPKEAEPSERQGHHLIRTEDPIDP